MAELGQALKAHGRGHALQGVGGAEQVAHRRQVPAALFQAQGPVAERLQIFVRLGDEKFAIFGVAAQGSSSTMAGTIWSKGSTLSTQPEAKAARGMP